MNLLFTHTQLYPKSKPEAERLGWHRHPNGNGWVQNTASVVASAFIGKNAQVRGNAQVSGNAQVRGKGCK